MMLHFKSDTFHYLLDSYLIFCEISQNNFHRSLPGLPYYLQNSTYRTLKMSYQVSSQNPTMTPCFTQNKRQTFYNGYYRPWHSSDLISFSYLCLLGSSYLCFFLIVSTYQQLNYSKNFALVNTIANNVLSP